MSLHHVAEKLGVRYSRTYELVIVDVPDGMLHNKPRDELLHAKNLPLGSQKSHRDAMQTAAGTNSN